jgi:hypothetical protein
MRPENVARALDLAWWAAAAAARPPADAAAARLRGGVAARMVRHHTSVLLGPQARGPEGDARAAMWAAATAAAAVALLAAAFPGSAAAGELGPALAARLRRRLRMWCTGARELGLWAWGL